MQNRKKQDCQLLQTESSEEVTGISTGVYTDEFVISGIWDGYGDTSAGFVSKAFYDETGYDLKNNGILCIKLNCNYVFPTTIQSIEKSLDFSDRQIFAPTGYIENFFRLLLGIR